MATSGRPLDEREREQIRKLRQQGVSVRETAKRVGVCTRTVQAHSKSGQAVDIGR